MLILGLDLETTCADVSTASLTEIGLCLWDSDLAAPVRMEGSIVYPGDDALWDDVVRSGSINGLTPSLCEKYGIQHTVAVKRLYNWIAVAEAVCCHNGSNFDKLIIKRLLTAEHSWDESKLWIDTRTDLDAPVGDSRRLSYMAADHGFLNPFAHRALLDALTTLNILSKYNLNRVLEIARAPIVTVRASVSYEDRGLASARGYHWNRDSKSWLLQIKKIFVDRERETAGFPITVLEDFCRSRETAGFPITVLEDGTYGS